MTEPRYTGMHRTAAEHDREQKEQSAEELKVDAFMEQIQERVELLSQRVFHGDLALLDAAAQMRELTQQAIGFVVESVAKQSNIASSDVPFAVFMYGSPVHRLMLPSSDLDVGLVFEERCPKELRALLRRMIVKLPFQQIDIAHWDSIEQMQKEHCTSMIDYTNAVDAEFVAGNEDLARRQAELVQGRDTTEDKRKRFITVYKLFHVHDYRSRKTKYGENLKYDFGASRDIVFLEWYKAIQNFPDNAKKKSAGGFFLFRCTRPKQYDFRKRT